MILVQLTAFQIRSGAPFPLLINIGKHQRLIFEKNEWNDRLTSFLFHPLVLTVVFSIIVQKEASVVEFEEVIGQSDPTNGIKTQYGRGESLKRKSL